nr:ComEC/Rec2 family competence protein [Candidatus Mycoplasma haematolamae]
MIPFFIYIYVFRFSWWKSLVVFGVIYSLYQGWSFLSSLASDRLGLESPLKQSREFLQGLVEGVISSNYQGEASQFISFLLLNKRSWELKDLFKGFNELSITHLMVISGMHMNLLKSLFQKICNFIPWKRARNLIPFLALGIYSWSTAFSLPASRVFFEELSGLKGKNASSLVRWSKSVWLTFIVFPQSILSYSFGLSYLFSFIFRAIDKLKLTNFKSKLVKTSVASLLVWFLFSYKTKKLFSLILLNQFLLTPLVMGIFLFYFFTWPFSFLSTLGNKIYSLFKEVIASLSINKAYIGRDVTSPLEPIYFLLALSLLGLALTKLVKSSPR